MDLNIITQLVEDHFWLSCLFVFILTFLHEIGWIAYIRGIAHKKLAWALLGNAWIISSGVLTTILVLKNIPSIIAAVCGGMLGILVLWPKLTKEE
jgi:hypothetical protein